MIRMPLQMALRFQGIKESLLLRENLSIAADT
jgi:hypothetical protein